MQRQLWLSEEEHIFFHSDIRCRLCLESVEQWTESAIEEVLSDGLRVSATQSHKLAFVSGLYDAVNRVPLNKERWQDYWKPGVIETQQYSAGYDYIVMTFHECSCRN